jgi:hypothetical protein
LAFPTVGKRRWESVEILWKRKATARATSFCDIDDKTIFVAKQFCYFENAQHWDDENSLTC